MSIYFKCFGLFVAFLLVNGCASKGSLFEVQAIPKNIEMSGYSLDVLDKRDGVQDLPPKVSFISFPWQDNKASLVIDDEVKSRFNKVIGEVKSDSNGSLEFKLEIFEGYLQFVADAFSEKEIVSWKLNLKAFANSTKVLDGNGACWGERKYRCFA